MLDILSAAASAGGPPGWIQFAAAGRHGRDLLVPDHPPADEAPERSTSKRSPSIKRGDQVVTGGGLVGKVIKVDDVYVEVEIAQGVKVKAVKADHHRPGRARRHAGQRLIGPRQCSTFPTWKKVWLWFMTLACALGGAAVAGHAQRRSPGRPRCPARRSTSGSISPAAATSCSKPIRRRWRASGSRPWKRKCARHCARPAAHPYRRRVDRQRPPQLPARRTRPRSIARAKRCCR